jgi:hypothetical protein
VRPDYIRNKRGGFPIMRIPKYLAPAALAALAACNSGPADNVQARAENAADAIERRAGELEAEAANTTGLEAQTLENQQRLLENEAGEIRNAADNRAEAIEDSKQ